jgi:aminoglycoside 6'-N-acetyltransferase
MLKIITAPGAAQWWGDYEGAEDDEELLSGWAIELEGTVIGWVGYAEEVSAKFPSVGLDIMITPEQHKKGYGPEALRGVIDFFVTRGHHRFTIDPSVGNKNAIRAYEKVGFRPVGVMRKSEQLVAGEWGDGLLMDLLAEELSS